MLHNLQINQLKALNDWFYTPQGTLVSNEFRIQLDLVSDYLKGDSLIQLGSCGDNLWLNSLQFKNKWKVSPGPISDQVDIQSSLSSLPLERNSLDCVLAPLTLEPFGKSNSLLDEIDRVLKPMGFIVLMSFNPLSLWGGALKLGLLSCYNSRKIKMRTPFHINRLFIQRGYRQCLLNNFCYIPPVKSPYLINKLIFLDEVGKMLWPFPSGFYIYIAQKYELISMNPILMEARRMDKKEYQHPLAPVIRGL